MSEPTGAAKPPLRIVVADDQASVREGLAAMLSMLPGIEVVAAVADGEQAVEAVATQHPDAILLDLRMPVLDGIEATRQLTRQHPEVAVVVLTTYDDDASVLAALRAGARSYITKDASRDDIARALRSAAAGFSVLDPAVQDVLLAAAATGPGQPDQEPAREPGRRPPDGLTRREAEILAMMARGMTNPDIAARLYLSAATIKSHINRIFAKTGSPDRAAAIRYARDHPLG
jgi:DNA-binding NarL/FixJ family response regulator